jgi:hypothetical protein
MSEGICRLCNQFSKLTYEHVPPRVTFNKHTRYKIINFMDYVKVPNPLDVNFKGKIEQSGLGYYTLCKSCNNFLGTTYVPSYQKYTNSFIEFAKKTQYNAFQLTMHRFEALKVLKQVVSMFLSINDETFSINNRELANFVLNQESQELPPCYRIFTYLNTEGEYRHIPISVRGDLKTGNTILGSEFAFPPLGHVLTVDFNGKLLVHQEITSFKQFRNSDLATVEINIYRLPTYLPFLLDYREKPTILDTINKSIKEFG